ncbi:MAG TPA: flagellar assembly peptidoglycan hydrolase FlgJ [Burkholderiaceae bacterium]|nr:flagellar assembly peptidoglycan hydrolase FlgJ [Burkholderiaceae bacterium]
MKPLDTNRLLDTASQGLAADAHSLDALKRTAARDPQAALKGAAQQFEALFLQMVLKSMRDAIPKSGLLDSDSEKTYTSMLDQQLSTSISKSGTGLADVIARQLGRYVVAPGASDAKKTPAAPSSLPPHAAIDHYVKIAGATPNVALRGGAQATDASLGEEQRSFVARMQEHAAAAHQATGIPAQFVLGQAALESGWGKREIRDSSGIPTYNLFGIKAGSDWQGRTVDVVTTEYENGTAKKVVGKFRAYNNYLEAFRDWAQLIVDNKRYADVVDSGRAGGSVTEFANGLARAGYATDPDYGAKLTRVIGTIADLRPGAGAPADKG